MSWLDELVAGAREDSGRRQQEVPLETLRAEVGTREGARPFNEALVRPGLSLIAEFKRRSPSVGEIGAGAGVADLVGAYERGGAAALSILTEERHFAGSLDDLRAARGASGLPILRKDFIVDRYQLYEAAANGADAVLLIVAGLEDDQLAGSLRRGARARPRLPGRGPRRDGSRARPRRRRRCDRDQQPQPRATSRWMSRRQRS